KDDFDAGRMQGANHHLELANTRGRIRRRTVTQFVSQKTKRIVTPIICQSAISDRALIRMVMHRHQLHRGDAETPQILDGSFGRNSEIRAAKSFRDFFVQLAESFYVEL